MRRLPLLVLATLTLLPLRARPEPAEGQKPGGSACTLKRAGSDALPAERCLGCHAEHGGAGSHPVGVPYGGAVAFGAAPRSTLRTKAEVIRRGVHLPDGRIQCVTCHDGASPWANHLALPPGSVPMPAVDLRSRGGIARGPSWRTATRATAPALPPRAEVSPAPLCAACHALD